MRGVHFVPKDSQFALPNALSRLRRHRADQRRHLLKAVQLAQIKPLGAPHRAMRDGVGEDHGWALCALFQSRMDNSASHGCATHVDRECCVSDARARRYIVTRLAAISLAFAALL